MSSKRTRLTAIAAAGVMMTAAAAAAWLTMSPASADLTTPAPNGGVYNIFLERDILTADPANAITGGGYWGHEGPDRSIVSTVFSADGTDGGTAIMDAFQIDDPIGQIFVAIVPTSADGSNERPEVAEGEYAGDAFDWFTEMALGGSLTGNTQGDGVLMVSTQEQWDDWVSDGKPDQLIESDLTVHDPLREGDPVSAHPKGSSLLNTWPAGTHLSLVFYSIVGLGDNNEPIVKRGADGRAISAWLPFVTKANPDRPIATSGGYDLVGSVVTPTVGLSQSWSGTTGTVTATVQNEDGDTLTDATGTIQFQARPKGATSGDYDDVGDAMTVTDGTASTQVTDLAAGEIRQFRAVYTPDEAASTKYAGATSGLLTVTPQTSASQPPTSQPPTSQPPTSQPPTPTPTPTVTPLPDDPTAAIQAEIKKVKAQFKKAKKAHNTAKAKKLKKKLKKLKKQLKAVS